MTRGPNQVRREQILDQLQEIFLSEGFLHLRIGALASRLRCSRSTLYELADSKEMLFVRVAERYKDNTIIDAAAEASSCMDPAERMLRFLEVISARQAGVSLAFWRDINDFGPTAILFGEARATGVSILRVYLEEGIAQGAFRPTNTALIAQVLWQVARASRDPEVLQAVGLDAGGVIAEYGRVLLHGILVDGPAAP